MFPANIATGDAFCDRVGTRKLLRQYMLEGMHSVVVAPRRYGKTSLIHQVLLEAKMPYAIIDLTLATSVSDVERLITRKIGELLQSILPKTTKAKQAVLDLFKSFNPELTLSAVGQTVVFHLLDEKESADAVTNITQLLMKLDESEKTLNKNVVLVFDEFQELTQIKGHVLEAGIRHAMQYSQNTRYVFSGSNRHMLHSMFNDKNRPFYNSCEVIKLGRISRIEYLPFIQAAAQKKWGKKLTSKVIDKIFSLSECHPSYVNRLCGHFWLTDVYPTVKRLETYWYNFVESRRSEFTKDVLALSKNQRRLLRFLSLSPQKQAVSRSVCKQLALSEASVRQALNTLSILDLVYKDSEGYIRVLDPALSAFIHSISTREEVHGDERAEYAE